MISHLVVDDLYDDEMEGTFEFTQEAVTYLKHYCFEKWTERASERGLPAPIDLSSSCKFTSLLAWKLFGGILSGNPHHQFIVLGGETVFDLNAEAMDVSLMDAPHEHDADFFLNDDHMASLASCLPRVNAWIDDLDLNKFCLKSELMQRHL